MLPPGGLHLLLVNHTCLWLGRVQGEVSFQIHNNATAPGKRNIEAKGKY